MMKIARSPIQSPQFGELYKIRIPQTRSEKPSLYDAAKAITGAEALAQALSERGLSAKAYKLGLSPTAPVEAFVATNGPKKQTVDLLEKSTNDFIQQIPSFFKRLFYQWFKDIRFLGLGAAGYQATLQKTPADRELYLQVEPNGLGHTYPNINALAEDLTRTQKK